MPAIVIQTRNITKRYGSLTAVENLSLDVYEGEVFGSARPERRRQDHLDQHAVRTAQAGFRRGACARKNHHRWRCRGPFTGGGMPAEYHSVEQPDLSRTDAICRRTVWVDGKTARQRSIQLLKDLDLEEKKDKQARTLSGGMQRRLNLALALIHDPEILVLDEPEAGLDPQSRVLTREYIKGLAHQKTIILTTHNMDEADRMADRVAIMDHGRLLMVDTPAALKHKVGEGDVLEIELDNDPAQALNALLPIVPGVSTNNHTLVIRARRGGGAAAGHPGSPSTSGNPPRGSTAAGEQSRRRVHLPHREEAARMRSFIVFRKTMREIGRDKWMLGLTLAFAPFFVFLYWLWFQGGSTVYPIAVINQDQGVTRPDGSVYNAGDEVVRAIQAVQYADGRPLLKVVAVSDQAEPKRSCGIAAQRHISSSRRTFHGPSRPYSPATAQSQRPSRLAAIFPILTT